MNPRAIHIDISKGICIILVVFGHSNLINFLPIGFDALRLFRVPLFFFLSGLFFKDSQDTTSLLAARFDALLKPYFATLGVVLLILIVQGADYTVWQLKGVLFASSLTEFNMNMWGPMWFLPHLFAVSLFVHFLLRTTSLQDWSPLFQWFFLLIQIAIGFATLDSFFRQENHILFGDYLFYGLPASADLILITSSFFIAGFLVKDLVINLNFRPALFFLAVIVFGTVSAFTDAYLDLHFRVYREPGFVVLAAISGIFSVLSLGLYIGRIKILCEMLTLFGRSSLFVLIFHTVIDHFSYEILISTIGKLGGFSCAVLAFFLSIMLPLLFRVLFFNVHPLAIFYFPLNNGVLKR